jgi:hypothetical protein
MRVRNLVTAGAFLGTAVCSPMHVSPLASLGPNSLDLFNQAMGFLDEFYDPKAGYLYDLSAAEGLRHESRQSVFYSLGLLARNQGDDAANAAKILYNIVEGQNTDPASVAYVPSTALTPADRANIGIYLAIDFLSVHGCRLS